MAPDAEKWIRFLRQYGPLPRNSLMYDEEIRRWATKLGIKPISFEHPLSGDVVAAFTERNEGHGGAVILTGTAGDGKSYLCYQVWEALGGSPRDWASNDIYFQLPVTLRGQRLTLHVIRDLTPLPDTDHAGRYSSKAQLLQALSASLFEPSSDLFLVAANDGQLLENWRKLGSHGAAPRALSVFEARLMNEEDPEATDRLRFFNLSVVPSSTVLTLALDAFLRHEGWQKCYDGADQEGFFGTSCPIRRNYELLADPLVKSRLTALFQLCDYNELHTPIRRVLLLLANAVLGHPSVKDRLMSARDVAKLIATVEAHRASLYNNLFGANLTPTKRESQEIFDYLGRFGIGHETTNRIDNILIFGSEDEDLRKHYQELIEADTFYGATNHYRAEQRKYVEMPDAQNGDRHAFLDMLVEQRRGLFFKIPDADADELKLWKLTVFTGAGDYLSEIAEPLEGQMRISRHTLSRLVKGLNRIFTGLLVSTDRELLLATSLAHSGARMSQLIEDRIAINARGRQEKIDIALHRGFPHLEVTLPNGETRRLALNLTRYEFLIRVSEGALPGNFSRECYEDILAFKSALLSAAAADRHYEPDDEPDLSFRFSVSTTAATPSMKSWRSQMPEIIALEPPPQSYYPSNEMWLDEQIWGHRLWDGQDPWLLFLEFLSVAEACHAEGQLLAGEDPPFPFSYRPTQRPYLRNLLYNNDKLSEIANRFPDDATAWAKWLSQMQDKAQMVENRDFSYLKRRFRSFQDFKKVIEMIRTATIESGTNKRWSSRFVFPFGRHAIYEDLNLKGGREYVYFTRNGELLYQMLARSGHAKELARHFAKLLERRDHCDRLLELLQPERVDDRQIRKDSYLPYAKHPAFEALADDWLAVLELKLPRFDAYPHLAILGALHLSLYQLSIAADLCKAKKPSFVCEVVAPRRTLIRELSASSFLNNNQLTQRAVEAYVLAISQTPEWRSAATDPAGFATCLQILRGKVRWPSKPDDYDGPSQSDDLLEHLRMAALRRHRQHSANVHRSLGGGAGLVSRRGTIRLRYAPTDDLLKALIFANVPTRIEYGQFLARLYDRYGLIFGDREAYMELPSEDFDKRAFQANAKRLENRLKMLGMLRRLSDACAYVENPLRRPPA